MNQILSGVTSFTSIRASTAERGCVDVVTGLRSGALRPVDHVSETS